MVQSLVTYSVSSSFLTAALPSTLGALEACSWVCSWKPTLSVSLHTFEPSHIGCSICRNACCIILSRGLAIVRGRLLPSFLGISTLLAGLYLYLPARRSALASVSHFSVSPSRVSGVPPGVVFPGLLFMVSHALRRLMGFVMSWKIPSNLCVFSLFLDGRSLIRSTQPLYSIPRLLSLEYHLAWYPFGQPILAPRPLVGLRAHPARTMSTVLLLSSKKRASGVSLYDLVYA